MRTPVRWLMTVAIGSYLLTSGQRVAAQDQRAAVLNAERAAAERSRGSGFAEAILGSSHRTGILLWPGAPVVAGTTDLHRFLSTLQTDSFQITWQPLGIELARDSSLAATWGVAVASAGGAPEIGRYIAAWQRDGRRWTIAALLFAEMRGLPKAKPGGTAPLSRNPIGTGGAAGPFVAADLSFARLAGDSGAAVAFERWAAPQAVTFGDGGLLNRGPKAIGRAVDFPAVWRWYPVAAGAAGTGDLGWTVGEATITGKDAVPTHSKYLTVWTRSADGALRFLTDGGNSRPASP